MWAPAYWATTYWSGTYWPAGAQAGGEITDTDVLHKPVNVVLADCQPIPDKKTREGPLPEMKVTKLTVPGTAYAGSKMIELFRR